MATQNSIEVKFAGNFQNGSYCSHNRRAQHDQVIPYYYVDCPASRAAGDPANWTFARKSDAEAAARAEAEVEGSGMRGWLKPYQHWY